MCVYKDGYAAITRQRVRVSHHLKGKFSHALRCAEVPAAGDVETCPGTMWLCVNKFGPKMARLCVKNLACFADVSHDLKRCRASGGVRACQTWSKIDHSLREKSGAKSIITCAENVEQNRSRLAGAVTIHAVLAFLCRSRDDPRCFRIFVQGL